MPVANVAARNVRQESVRVTPEFFRRGAAWAYILGRGADGK